MSEPSEKARGLREDVVRTAGDLRSWCVAFEDYGVLAGLEPVAEHDAANAALDDYIARLEAALRALRKKHLCFCSSETMGAPSCEQCITLAALDGKAGGGT